MKTKYTLLLFTRKITAALLSLIVLISALFLQPTSAAAQENARIIVSLGDSYSSGEGIEEFYDQNLPIEEKVKSRDWLAQRSTRSWPGMLTLSDVDGNMASHRGENWFFVAASGAETKHMTEKQEKIYSKQGHEGTTYLPPQLKVFEKLRGKKVDYVTLTLGGNDAKFLEIITKTPATHHFKEGNMALISNRIDIVCTDTARYKRQAQGCLLRNIQKSSRRGDYRCGLSEAPQPRRLECVCQ